MKTIAITGKGGTGKSTISSMIIRWIGLNLSRSILAVDADSNVNLNDLLGVPSAETLGNIREELKAKVNDLPGGMTKQDFLDYKVKTSLTETGDFDLIAMGRPEGPGCYCYSNNLLRDILSTLSENYDWVVMDNEAGMEHLSRRTTQSIDHLFIISDPSVRGVKTAGKISRILQELDTRVQNRHLILNRVRSEVSSALKVAIEEEGLFLLGSLPEDETIFLTENSGKPLFPVITNTPSFSILNQMLKKLFFQTGDRT